MCRGLQKSPSLLRAIPMGGTGRRAQDTTSPSPALLAVRGGIWTHWSDADYASKSVIIIILSYTFVFVIHGDLFPEKHHFREIFFFGGVFLHTVL